MTDSIGKLLRTAREERHLSLEQVAHATRIRLRFLQALEADDFAAMPSSAQMRGFLRAYAEQVGLPVQPLFNLLDGVPTPETEGETAPPPADTPAPTSAGGSAAATFANLGRQLRSQREQLGLSLEDVERHTFLRLRYLRALEEGDLSGLPSPVQGRGMLSNYATFLGLDSEAMLLKFAEGLQESLAERQQSSPARQTSQAKRQGRFGMSEPETAKPLIGRAGRFFSGDLLVGAALVIFLLAFMVWGVLYVSDLQASQVPEATAPSVADVLAPTTQAPGTPTITPESALIEQTGTIAAPESNPEASATPELEVEANGSSVDIATVTSFPTVDFPVVESGKVQLYLVGRQRAWMRVTVDGEVEFEGRVVPGSAYLFTGDEQVEVLTGNGAALQAFLNREDLGPLGIIGEVVQRVFTPQGVLAPTSQPTAANTPTETPNPAGETATPTPSPTSTTP
jgi:cytoskeletal protein RodZ